MTAAGERILIIGRSGQVSRSLYERLTASGHHIVQIGRPEIDLCDRVGLSDAICAARPAVVINAAAYTAVDRAEDEPEAAYAVNAEGARNVAEAAEEAGAPIIHFSTDYVFDGTKHTLYIETDAVAPTGIYGQTKLAGETLVAAANSRHVILRTAWVFSPFGSNFVKAMLRLNIERPEINVVNDQHGNPTYAPDLAEAVRGIILRLKDPALPPEFFGLFHAVNSGETTWYDFARAIIDGAAQRGEPHAVVRPIETSGYPTKAKRPAYSVLSPDKLSRIYGIRLRPWQDALSEALDRLVGPPQDESSQQRQQTFGQTA